MKHNIDELFGDAAPLRKLANESRGGIHIEAFGIDPNDLDFDETQLPVEDLPILAIRDAVLFPLTSVPVAVGRTQSKRILNEANRSGRIIGVVTQRNEAERPQRKDLYDMGCYARVASVAALGEGEMLAILFGGPRFLLGEVERAEPYLTAKVTPAPPEDESDFHGAEARTKITALRRKFTEMGKNAHEHFTPPSNVLKILHGNRTLVNMIAAHALIETNQKEALLEITNLGARVDELLKCMSLAQEARNLEREVDRKARHIMDQQQREYYLNQQMHAIQDELGGSPYEKEIRELEERAKKKQWGKEAAEHFQKELQKLRRIPPQQPDYSVQQNYLEFMLDLPWNEGTEDNLDIDHARKTLDHDHYGLEKIKERILEYVAVMQLKGDMKAPILCLVGPPGTGKTSLGKSIADALNRKYVRMALGGVHDESEIRGHRRTYVGAMAGRVLESVKRAGSSNPVFILDEIDKVQSNSFNGDPTAALLEALDPEQNNAFHDNYLDLDYDLSKVMFIATANSLATIQPALLDRMEVIELSGYILEEKEQIARRHLLPRLLKEHGIAKSQLRIPPSTMTQIIDQYTLESGVRQLDKQLAQIVRRRAVKKVSGEEMSPTVRLEDLKELLGLPLHTMEKRNRKDMVGIVTGLAWTAMGGVILFVEASKSKGKGDLSLTGNLGDVMKESATLAFEYLKANAEHFGIKIKEIENSHLHIHVPEGATPKDGPSAGITMFVAMVSVFSNRKVRSNTAMTGEITLRGAVTPVGGIKEKILAAKRAGITDLLLCEENRRDVEDINKEYLQGLTFHYINEMKDALPLALLEN
ncbi:MAG: endopeptidase La [Bacteroidales bacterium]|nr:endopeptidase La [Bacteroidales bacterium]